MRLDEAVEFAENPEPRCPCVLLLDVSTSMSGEKINALNEGLRLFEADLNQDELAKKRVEIAILTFDTRVKVVQEFVTADQFAAPKLKGNGTTSMGEAINQALDLIQIRKQVYKENGVEYYRPWVFMITDGAPTDNVEEGMRRIKFEEEKKRVAFFAVGVQGADMNKLAEIVVRTPLKLKGLSFKELFQWLSASIQGVSHSQVGEQVPLKPPTGWAEV
ncbi:MAG: VWA domain-containing protein [Gomphosphaeria aponina SAG 52.96 = DSM 107014]|uniref:VWA domain-containing protein n=1 Tax=Gomphosphaeria aponina SAG 52.96 = DSM 107014 TaxID=1521640 RepID=A0A941GTI2_9CHRO|nr:VWA domain-containing protein [Gomphosphaeria aponina SAG 52.96 = DSM 107014]